MLDLIIVFLIILILFICTNMCLKKYIERYGVYCGRYKTETDCSNDNECLWNILGTGGWCSQNTNQSS